MEKNRDYNVIVNEGKRASQAIMDIEWRESACPFGVRPGDAGWLYAQSTWEWQHRFGEPSLEEAIALREEAIAEGVTGDALVPYNRVIRLLKGEIDWT